MSSKCSSKMVIKNCHQKLSSNIVIKNFHQKCHQQLTWKIVINNCHQLVRTIGEDKMLRTKCWIRNVEDKMLRTKCWGQNVEDKMLRTKCWIQMLRRKCWGRWGHKSPKWQVSQSDPFFQSSCNINTTALATSNSTKWCQPDRPTDLRTIEPIELSGDS